MMRAKRAGKEDKLMFLSFLREFKSSELTTLLIVLGQRVWTRVWFKTKGDN